MTRFLAGYLSGLFFLVALMLTFVPVAPSPGSEIVRHMVQGVLLLIALGLRSLCIAPADHWIHRSILVTLVLLALAAICTFGMVFGILVDANS